MFEGGEPRTAFMYGPFGEILDQEGELDPENSAQIKRFNGKEHDDLSGLSYYGARYYDPLSLSWTQSDPLYRFNPDLAYDDPRRMNLYVFTLNNPVRYSDPDGRAVPLAGIALRGAIAGAGLLLGGTTLGGIAVSAMMSAEPEPNPANFTDTSGQAHLRGMQAAMDGEADAQGGKPRSIPTRQARHHGNSDRTRRAQHGYEIKDQNGDVVKVGISSSKLKNGKSPRAEKQASKWNRKSKDCTYEACVVVKDVRSRKKIKVWEREHTDKRYAEGHSLRRHKRPHPKGKRKRNKKKKKRKQE